MSAADDRLPLQQHTAPSGPGHTDKSPVIRPCFLAQLPVPAVSPVAMVAHPSGGGDATAAQKHTTVSVFQQALHQWCKNNTQTCAIGCRPTSVYRRTVVLAHICILSSHRHVTSVSPLHPSSTSCVRGRGDTTESRVHGDIHGLALCVQGGK